MADPIQSTGGEEPPSHLRLQGKVNQKQVLVDGEKATPGHRTHQIQRRLPLVSRSFLHWLPSLTEDDPTGPRDRSSPQGNSRRRRLSPFGQVVLAGGFLVAGLLILGGAWTMSQRTTNLGKFCLKLPDSREVSPRGDGGESLPLRAHQHGDRLIQALPAAYPGQRIRLRQQLEGLIQDIDSACRLNIFYFNQQGALLTLATISATGVVICLVLMAPQGVQNINLTQRTVMFTSAGVLGMTVNLLQLGQLQTNIAKARENYLGRYALLMRFESSLANQRLEKGLTSNSGSQLLNTPTAVAQLISAVDTRRLTLPDPRMTLNSSLAEVTWTRLLAGDLLGDNDGRSSDSKGEPAAPQPLQAEPK